jgi:hypothetical protein
VYELKSLHKMQISTENALVQDWGSAQDRVFAQNANLYKRRPCTEPLSRTGSNSCTKSYSVQKTPSAQDSGPVQNNFSVPRSNSVQKTPWYKIGVSYRMRFLRKDKFRKRLWPRTGLVSRTRLGIRARMRLEDEVLTAKIIYSIAAGRCGNAACRCKQNCIERCNYFLTGLTSIYI